MVDQMDFDSVDAWDGILVVLLVARLEFLEAAKTVE